MSCLPGGFGDEGVNLLDVVHVGTHRQVTVEGLSLLPLDDEQREVVALLGIANKAMHFAFHHLGQLLRRTVGVTAHQIIDLPAPEQFFVSIPGLTQTVGKEEQRVAAFQHRLLTFVVPVGQGTHRQITLDGQRLSRNERRFMTGIAVIEMAGTQVEYAYEHRHEVACRVLVTEIVIHRLHDGCGTVALSGLAPEHGTHDGHHQGCGNSLAADIANTEQEAVVAEEEVVEVATYLACRIDKGMEADVASLGEGLGEQGHLDAVGNFEFLLYGGFLGSGCLQLLHILS